MNSIFWACFCCKPDKTQILDASSIRLYRQVQTCIGSYISIFWINFKLRTEIPLAKWCLNNILGQNRVQLSSLNLHGYFRPNQVSRFCIKFVMCHFCLKTKIFELLKCLYIICRYIYPRGGFQMYPSLTNHPKYFLFFR